MKSHVAAKAGRRLGVVEVGFRGGVAAAPRALRPTALALACAGVLASGVALAQNADGAVTLDTVVITASGFEQTVADAPASITVVPRAELEKKAYKDITDALKDVPGVVVTGGGSSSDISVRGMASAYTMILVDGRRQNSRETRPNSDGAGIEQGGAARQGGGGRIRRTRKADGRDRSPAQCQQCLSGHDAGATAAAPGPIAGKRAGNG